MEGAVIASIAVALIAPVGAYLLAARKMSGKIGTSDAGQLWQESKAIREDYRSQLLQSNERALSLEIRMAKAETANSDLRRENDELRRKIDDLESLVKKQSGVIEALQTVVEAQRKELGNGPSDPTI